MAFKDFSRKIIANITKNLLQSYQNFTNQNQNSWVMGRLNGDGTASLPDGTTVKVLDRGIPGLYCRLFNLGNGFWLADVPSAHKFVADSNNKSIAFIFNQGILVRIAYQQKITTLYTYGTSQGLSSPKFSGLNSSTAYSYQITPTWSYNKFKEQELNNPLVANLFTNIKIILNNDNTTITTAANQLRTSVSLKDRVTTEVDSRVQVPSVPSETSQSSSTSCSRTYGTGGNCSPTGGCTYNSFNSSSITVGVTPFDNLNQSAQALFAAAVVVGTTLQISTMTLNSSFIHSTGIDLSITSFTSSGNSSSQSNSTVTCVGNSFCGCVYTNFDSSFCSTTNGVGSYSSTSSSSGACYYWCEEVPPTSTSGGGPIFGSCCNPAGPGCFTQNTGNIALGNGGSVTETGQAVLAYTDVVGGTIVDMNNDYRSNYSNLNLMYTDYTNQDRYDLLRQRDNNTSLTVLKNFSLLVIFELLPGYSSSGRYSNSFANLNGMTSCALIYGPYGMVDFEGENMLDIDPTSSFYGIRTSQRTPYLFDLLQVYSEGGTTALYIFKRYSYETGIWTLKSTVYGTELTSTLVAATDFTLKG